MQTIKRYLLPKDGRFHIDFLSGLTVALALIPEAIAFALVANVNPLVGLYAAFFMCLISAVLGGRPGMISGATGSMAVVMVSLVSQYDDGQFHLSGTTKPRSPKHTFELTDTGHYCSLCINTGHYWLV